MIVKIVGGGLAGCVCARLLAEKNYKVEIYEKENHIGGLLYDKEGEDVFQHYGPHIFHTSNPEVISFVLRFAEWLPYCNRPLAVTDKGLARLPISIETVIDLKNKKLDDKVSVDKEKRLIEKHIIKGYSKKQWGENWDNNAIKRLKVNPLLGGSYFNDVFEGLPKKGFYEFLMNIIRHPNINVYLNKKIVNLNSKNDIVIWTAPFDENPNAPIKLKWYGTKFKRVKDKSEYLTAVYNYNIDSVKYTRTTKMKLLTNCKSEDVLVEIPRSSLEKHYINITDKEAEKVRETINKLREKNIYFCGRAATASYLDMDEVIEKALNLTKVFTNQKKYDIINI